MDRSDQIESILADALEIESEAERHQFVERACGGDAELRREVEELIESHVRASGFFERLAVRGPEITTESAPRERPGTIIGPYKLVEQIGEGGFGTVFVAEQRQPVRRQVALKVLKPGMDTAQVVARFEAERQALALMNHPNIAQVFDGGETVTGRPYFVMELVKGVPITKYCDERQLSPRERLALFVPVCEAVQHAHQKGIIHRDIKPSNVLVAAYDGRPVPKVIDFGVAKALGQQLTERTLVTSFGGIVGTLEYMSPEQAELNALDIDTRVDVYGLGVLLYELLTGTTPLTKHRTKEAALTEILRLIREEEPPTPSTRLGESSDSLASISALRKLEPSRLTKEVRGELDWIVMKCLEKERTRRYETANGLARDIQRFLNDEPVEAGPPSATYKLRKFARKHRTVIWVTAAFVILLAAGAIISTWQAVRATSAANAERLAKEAEGRRRKQAREALDAMSSQLIEGWLATQTVLLPEHKKFLEMALHSYEEFAADTGQEEESRNGVAHAQARVALIRERLGQWQEAEVAWERSRELYAGLAADVPSAENYRCELAGSHQRLGHLYHKTGRNWEAEANLRQALAIYGQLAEGFPDVAIYRHAVAITLDMLGVLVKDSGRPNESEEIHNQALAIHKQLVADFPTVPKYRDELAQTYLSSSVLKLDSAGGSRETEDPLRQAVAIYTQLATDFPRVPRYRDQLASCRNNLGNLLRDAKRHPEAEKIFRETLTIQRQLLADFPAVPSNRRSLAMTLNNLGILLKNTGRAVEAEELYGQAAAIHKQLAADFPGIPDHQNEAAGALVNLARLLLARKELDGARRLLEEGVPYHLAALKAAPHHPAYRNYYRLNRWRMAETLLALKDHVAAAATAEEFLQAATDPPRDAYTAACLLAGSVKLATEDEQLTESKRQELITTYGDRAIAALRLAIEKGAKEIAGIKTDPSLDPLRLPKDFQKMLRELESEPEA